jgi:PhnB protein
MSKRPPRPQGSPWMMPYLTVKDADATLDFYQRAFGFEKCFAMPGPDGRTGHVEMRFREAKIMFSPESAMAECPGRAPATSGVASPIGLYVYCEDVDALFARAVAAGAKAVHPPQDMFWGDRMCHLTDPDGHAWSFATNVGDFDPSKAPK